MGMTNTASAPRPFFPQQALTLLRKFSVTALVRADAMSPALVDVADELLLLGLVREFDNGPDAVRVFTITEAGRAALARANQAARDVLGAILADAVAIA